MCIVHMQNPSYSFKYFKFQVPIAIISPGKQSKTRSEIASVIESGHEVICYQEDLTNVYKQRIPIVNI